MNSEIKTTPLHQWHVDNGANMAAFGAYDMPLWYPHGAKGEHLAVINSAGLFDTSHMAMINVLGKDGRELLQQCFSKDLECCIGHKKNPLGHGRSVYGLFLNQNGHVIDDAIVSQVTDNLYMIVVNAGMGGPIAAHLEKHKDELEADIIDYTDRLGKVDIQGPQSAKILKKVLQDPNSVFDVFPYFSFKGWFSKDNEQAVPVKLSDGTPILLSRTGYTGEFGFEIFTAAGKVESVWIQLLAAGEEFSLIPCGLAARDSLRVGAVLPLSHQDVGDWPFADTPWPFALCDLDDAGNFSKDFIGADALASRESDEYTLPFAGYDPRKMVVSEKSYVADEAGNILGVILTCATDMAIGRVGDKIISIASKQGKPEDFVPRGLSCGFIKVDRRLKSGDVVFLTDGKRKIKVEICSDIRPDRTARQPLIEMI